MLKLLALLLSGAKLGKLLTTGGTMLISLVVYAWLYGWRYAAGFIALLFVHEMGHFIAARHKGLNVGLPTFIPFVGAWVELKDMPHDAQTEAFVGLAGPLLGTVGATAAASRPCCRRASGCWARRCSWPFSCGGPARC